MEKVGLGGSGPQERPAGTDEVLLYCCEHLRGAVWWEPRQTAAGIR